MARKKLFKKYASMNILINCVLDGVWQPQEMEFRNQILGDRLID